MSKPLFELLYETDGREVSIDAGQYAFHAGDPVRTLYVVLEGEVRLVRHLPGGLAHVLQRAGPCSVLAEASLFSACYHCDAVASAAVRLRGLPVRDLRQRFRTDAGFAEAWAVHLAKEVQAARFRSEVVALRTVGARLDTWLAWHGGPAPLKGAQKHIADQIGVSPEALYRELAKRRRSDRAQGEAPQDAPRRACG